MAKQWLRRCCVGAMIAAMTASSLPMQAFAEAGGVAYDAGVVTASVNGNTATIGNGAIERTFSIAEGGQVKTTKIDNKRAGTTLTPGEGSEEFIIKRTKKDNAANNPLDQSGWTAKADSEEKKGENGPHHGHASNAIDNNPNTFWHSQYKDDDTGNDLAEDKKPDYPHYLTISLQRPTTFKSFSYDPRQSGANGNIKGYELYVSTQENCPAIPEQTAVETSKYEGWTKVSAGDFEYSKENPGDPIHVNIEDKDLANCKDVRHVMLVATSAVKTADGKKFAACEEFDLYAEPWSEQQGETPMLLKSSELKLKKASVKDASDVINKQQKTGKQLSFEYEPVVFNGAEYTITENIVAYNGDHYLRKFLDISVPDADKLDAEIDYIDLESLNVSASKDRWTIPTDKGSIVGAPKERAILGQPFYADGMFFGCEFPAADTQIVNEDGKQIGRPRYYTGKTMDRLAVDEQAERSKVDGTIHYATWPTVTGAATGTDYRMVQADFFDYIDDISVPSEFRIQYNSWYDEEKEISDQTILSSFAEIDREMENTELRPLDSYVIDDGWMNYSANPGFWEFDKNKFPEGFTPSSSLAQSFDSDLGVWIGPRGGYGTNGTIATEMEKQGFSVKAGNAIDVADRTYLEKYAELVCKFQDQYHVNYWKWDGFADQDQYNHYNNKGAGDGVPKRSNEVLNSKTEGHMIGGKNQMYHCSDMWEAWIQLYEKVLANAEKNHIENYWISSTTHTIPSPWLLQWVNSMWLQCQFDHARTSRGTTVHDGNLNARDAVYYSYVVEHQFQIPLKHIYNHDPVYGKHGTSMDANTATAEQFQNYLYTMAGRGTAFWELYYSDSIFDEEKYEVNSQFLNWYEDNFHLLRNARMFGKWPVEGVTLDTGAAKKTPHTTLNDDGKGIYNTYGYAGFEGDEGILTVRNANDNTAQTLDFVFDDATLGVKGNKGEEFEYVVERRHTQKDAKSKVADRGIFTIGQQVSLELQPEESLTIRVTKSGAGDKQGPSIASVMSDGKTGVTVRMDERVKGEPAITINGKQVDAKSIKRSADDITFHVTLDEAPKDGSKLSVEVSGVTDAADNALARAQASMVFHEDSVVASRCPSRLTTYTKKIASADKSLVSNTGLTVFSKVKTTGNGTLVKQEGAYELGIDESGCVYFDLNGVRATSKIAVNDGGEHTIAGVRENNGNLKVYVDGKGSAAKYDAKNYRHELPAGDILFAGGAFDKANDEASAKVYDRALGYNEIKAMHDRLLPDTSERNISKGKQVKAAWTDNDADAAKGQDCPMRLAVNGDHSNSNAGHYAEFGTDRAAKSSYMEIDLGDVHELTGMHLWRYWLTGGRTYKDTLIVTSVDNKFGSKDEDSSDDVIVFNADKKNVHGFGKGAEDGYAETKDGHAFPVPAGTRARYVRLYMNGRNDGNTNHVVEFEVMGRSLPSDPGTQIDTSKLYQRIDEVRVAVESGKWTPESVQKVMDKLEAAELVADCPKDEAQVAKAIEDLNGVEDLLKKAVTVTFAYKGDVPADAVAPAAVDIEQGDALGDKLPVPTAEGYVFTGWFVDEACTSGNEFTSKTKVGADMTVFGKWVKDSGTVPPAPGPENPGPEGPEQPKPEQPGDPKPEQPNPEQSGDPKPNKPGKPGSGLPQTGDDSMLPIAACGVASVALMATALVIRKRRNAR